MSIVIFTTSKLIKLTKLDHGHQADYGQSDAGCDCGALYRCLSSSSTSRSCHGADLILFCYCYLFCYYFVLLLLPLMLTSLILWPWHVHLLLIGNCHSKTSSMWKLQIIAFCAVEVPCNVIYLQLYLFLLKAMSSTKRLLVYTVPVTMVSFALNIPKFFEVRQNKL